MNFKGKCVFISGITRGIGRATAIEFAKKDAIVVGCARSSQDNYSNLIEELQSYNKDNTIFVADVADYSQMEKVFLECQRRFNRIDILVNNAGIIRDSMLMNMSEKQWDDVFNVNIKGTYICTRLVSKLMKENGYGKIINVSSIAASTPNKGQSNYAASKGAIEAFTRSVAIEFAKYGINVNCVAPGCIETSMYENVSDRVISMFREGIPMGRFGTAEEIANVIMFLGSSYADYITGETIRVDGGFSVSLL